MILRRSLLLATALLFIFSCKKEEAPAPEPEEPAPVTTGNISGSVKIYDQFGTVITTNLSASTVSVDGSQKTATTNAQGRYTLTDMSAGSYTFSFSKTNCSTTKTQLVYKLGDTLSCNGEVAEKPSFTISNAYVKDTTWFTGTLPGVYYRAFSAETNTAASAVALVGKTKNVNIADPSTYVNYAGASPIYKEDYNRFLSYSFLKSSYGFVKKDTVYIRIYPVSARAGGYVDGKLNKTVYSAYGQAYPALFKLVIP